MEKINIGMYVRTKDGIIAKVDYIDDNTIFFDKDLYKTYSDSIDFLEKDNLERIVKASYNIIDILEVGDYVNGNKVDFTNNNNKLSYEDKCIGFYDGDGDITLFENGIKSVITHEQMEQMAYRVGE